MRREILKFDKTVMSRVTRGEKLLATLAASNVCELSKDGSNYVKERFDPYHDLPMKPVGYPDSYNGSTVTRCIKKSVTISATSGGADPPSTTWSCHIVDTPLENPRYFLQNAQAQGGVNNVFADPGTDPASNTTYGGIMAIRSDNQQWTYPPLDTFTVGQLNLTPNDLKNVMRIVSSGWEVIDETAELYKQGTLTAYRQNQQQNTPQVYTKVQFGIPISTANNYISIVSGQTIKFPPANVAAAMLSPNTKQWLVKEGAYVVTDYNSDELPMVEPTYVEPVLIQDNVEVLMATAPPATTKFNTDFWMPPMERNQLVNQLWSQTTTPVTTFNERWCPISPNRITPKNQSGVFLTGLNPQASITLNKIWYVECAPTGEDEELLSLCSQSPEYDPVALKIVAALRRDSPVAVKLRENYLGEWFFNGIRDFVSSAMPWLSNASTVGNQIVKWVDTANTNNGYITPQSFVKGDVAKKVAKEKKKDQAIIIKPAKQGKGKAGPPKAPGPAPKKVAFTTGKSLKPQRGISVEQAREIAELYNEHGAWSQNQQQRIRRLNTHIAEMTNLDKALAAEQAARRRKKKAKAKRGGKNGRT